MPLATSTAASTVSKGNGAAANFRLSSQSICKVLAKKNCLATKSFNVVVVVSSDDGVIIR